MPIKLNLLRWILRIVVERTEGTDWTEEQCQLLPHNHNLSLGFKKLISFKLRGEEFLLFLSNFLYFRVTFMAPQEKLSSLHVKVERSAADWLIDWNVKWKVKKVGNYATIKPSVMNELVVQMIERLISTFPFPHRTCFLFVHTK